MKLKTCKKNARTNDKERVRMTTILRQCRRQTKWRKKKSNENNKKMNNLCTRRYSFAERITLDIHVDHCHLTENSESCACPFGLFIAISQYGTRLLLLIMFRWSFYLQYKRLEAGPFLSSIRSLHGSMQSQAMQSMMTKTKKNTFQRAVRTLHIIISSEI